MKIKNIDADSEIWVTYREWLTDYVKTEKHKYFEVTNDIGIVEVHRVNPDTGKLEFRILIDKDRYYKNPSALGQGIYIKPLSYEYYDKNLIINKPKSHSFLNFLKRPFTIKKRPNKNNINDNKSILSKFWSLISENQLISGLILLFIGLEIKYNTVSNFLSNIFSNISF